MFPSRPIPPDTPLKRKAAMDRPIESGGYMQYSFAWWITCALLAAVWIRAMIVAGW